MYEFYPVLSTGIELFQYLFNENMKLVNHRTMLFLWCNKDLQCSKGHTNKHCQSLLKIFDFIWLSQNRNETVKEKFHIYSTC